MSGTCHILGHEEAMLMRPEAIVVTPNAPSNLAATNTTGGVMLTWTDNSTNEINWTIQRSLDNANWTTIASMPSTTGPGKDSTVLYTDTNATVNTTYYYRVLATNIVGDTTMYAAPASGYPNMAVDSLPSNTASITTPTPIVTQTTEQLVSGYNLIGLGIIPDPPIYASNLLYTAPGGIPGVTKVVRWNPTAQQWEGYEYIVADGIYLGNNFTLDGYKAYFIKGNESTAGQTYTFKGRR